MAHILLGVTGSVAALRTPELFAEVTRRGHEARIVATRAATYFFDVEPLRPHVSLDEDEWPGRRYVRGSEVLHIELRRWADALVIAPLDANTLAKLAFGLCDNCLTCVHRAWDSRRPILVAPAMNTLMWESPVTVRHLRMMAANAGAEPPEGLSLEALPGWINAHCPKLRIVPPDSRMLACGDVGVGAMASVGAIVEATTHALEIVEGEKR
jgi:phosphopantothenoylcysteine decarboxylase